MIRTSGRSVGLYNEWRVLLVTALGITWYGPARNLLVDLIRRAAGTPAPVDE